MTSVATCRRHDLETLNNIAYLARDSTEVSAIEPQDALVMDDRLEGCRGGRELLGLHPLLDHLSRNTYKAGGLFRQGRIRNEF